MHELPGAKPLIGQRLLFRKVSVNEVQVSRRPEEVMAYKIAGIDVHKKVLMVVVIDASTPESKPERRRFATIPE
jgi:hypothetical protein